MKSVLIVIVLLVFAVSIFEAKDLTLGTRVNNLLISTEKVVYNKIPFIRRDKDYAYTDPKQRIIKLGWKSLIRADLECKVNESNTLQPVLLLSDALVLIRGEILVVSNHVMRLEFVDVERQGIIARDLSRTEGEVTVTAGGVGETYVTLHLRSGKGEGLNYLILIFSSNS